MRDTNEETGGGRPPIQAAPGRHPHGWASTNGDDGSAPDTFLIGDYGGRDGGRDDAFRAARDHAAMHAAEGEIGAGWRIAEVWTLAGAAWRIVGPDGRRYAALMAWPVDDGGDAEGGAE